MKKRIISFHYTLKNDAGKTLDASAKDKPLQFLEGAGQIIPGLEKELGSLKTGNKKKIKVVAKEAYGERDDRFLLTVGRDQLPKEAKVGEEFEIKSDKGSLIVVVKELNEKQAVLDGNHPLAGVDLYFDVEIIEAREATDEELSHGHAHGADGHHH